MRTMEWIGGLFSRVDYGASLYVICDFKIAHKKTWLFCGSRDNATNSFEFIIFQLESTRTHENTDTRVFTRRRACIASLSEFSMFQEWFRNFPNFCGKQKNSYNIHNMHAVIRTNKLVSRWKRGNERQTERERNQWTTTCVLCEIVMKYARR